MYVYTCMCMWVLYVITNATPSDPLHLQARYDIGPPHSPLLWTAPGLTPGLRLGRGSRAHPPTLHARTHARTHQPTNPPCEPSMTHGPSMHDGSLIHAMHAMHDRLLSPNGGPWRNQSVQAQAQSPARPRNRPGPRRVTPT